MSMNPRSVWVLGLSGAAACNQADPPGPPVDPTCAEAEARLGYRACLPSVEDRPTWESMARFSVLEDRVRTGLYLMPVASDGRLPGLFVDAQRYDLHIEFLQDAFPGSFPGITVKEYNALILEPKNEFRAGEIVEYRVDSGDTVLFGYTVWDDPTQPSTYIDCDDVVVVDAWLREHFTLEPLAFVPAWPTQRLWYDSCGIASYDPDVDLEYEVYTPAEGFGTIRRYTLPELALATATSEFRWQDILVLDEAPFDIETVISGAVTGTRQGELSHLNVRSVARGTPNCFVQGAHAVLSSWDGELVRLECAVGSWNVRAATPAEAQAWWEQLRPDPVAVPVPDLEHTDLIDLLELDTVDASARTMAVTRYGSKASNLAAVYQRIGVQHRLPGFAIPAAHYAAFMTENGLDDVLAGVLSDPELGADGRLRREALADLRQAMVSATVDDALVAQVSAQIRAIFGRDDLMVRFRSSSNAEDDLRFSGAGIYDSTSACLADEEDGDDAGPSRCDSQQEGERTIRRALKLVWSSLWNARAYDERAWYQIDQRDVAMAVLVNARVADERANAVVFSGHPTDSEDDRFLVNAQLGDIDVVRPPPGVVPEKTLVTLAAGVVVEIDRVSESSEVEGGQRVMTDAQLEVLGASLWEMVQAYPVDAQAPAGTTTLLDTEWKVRSDGVLVIKQIRPFSRAD